MKLRAAVFQQIKKQSTKSTRSKIISMDHFVCASTSISELVHRKNKEFQDELKNIPFSKEYQQFHGKMYLVRNTDYKESIHKSLYDSWMRLNDSIPVWSYDIVKHECLKYLERPYTPSNFTIEIGVGRDFARETIKTIEKFKTGKKTGATPTGTTGKV